MREILASYQTNCLLTGLERTRLLQKVISAAVAYSTPCVNGSVDDGLGFYRNLALPIALKVVSEVNERVMLDTQQALTDVQELYLDRYNVLNTPLVPVGKCAFACSLTDSGFDYTQHYNYWAPKFLRAVVEYLAKSQEA